LHGKGNHTSENCWTLKKQAKGNGKNHSSNTAKSFSSRSFKKEINSLTKTSKKRKVLEQYAAAARHELAKLEKATKRTASDNESSSSDESVISVKVVEEVAKKRSKKKKVSFPDDKSEESGVTAPMEKLTLGVAPEDISDSE